MQAVRVKVWNGDQSEYLGEGTWSENVRVWFAATYNHKEIYSLKNAEVEPTEDDLPEGTMKTSIPNNPKIVLDSGRVVYGCQVWWEPIK